MDKESAKIQLPDGRIAYDAVKLAGLETEGVWLKDCTNHIIVVRTKRGTKYTLVCENGKIKGTGVRENGTISPYMPPDSEVRINGCTFGGSMLKMGYLGVGMHMEFVFEDKVVTTTSIQSLVIVEQGK